MKKSLGISGKSGLLVLFTLASAFAIRPDEGPQPTEIQGKSNPYLTGFTSRQPLSKADFLEADETLQAGKADLKGDAQPQIVRRLNAKFGKGGSEVRVTSIQSDSKGNQHIRLLQYYKGLPVIGGDVVVHVDAANAVYAVGGGLTATLTISETPKLKPEQARANARNALSVNATAVDKQDPKLVVFNGTLAYEVLIQDAGLPPKLWKGYVDAENGELIYRENQILHGAPVGGAAQTVQGNRLIGEDGAVTPITGWLDNLSLYFLHNTTNHWGVYNQVQLDWSQNTSADWGITDRAAISLAKNMETTQRYVTTVLGRNSYNDAGAFATAYVHEGTNYVNAYWDGTAFHFGDGDGVQANALTVLDVAAHEYGHAITQYTSNLVYSSESGALNESYSDIMGAAVEFWNQPDGRSVYPTSTDGRADYLLGEDCWLGRDALRDMRNPQRFGQPSYYLGTAWYTGTGDNGGVHTNSGVQNFAYYLLSEGGTGNNDGHAYAITGLGNQVAAEIASYANRFLLTSSSQYRDARDAWILAATTLGYNAQTVRDVWTACGVLGQVNNLSVSPTNLAYGNVGAGSIATLNLTLSNNGAMTTTVTDLTFDNAVFSTTAAFPLTVTGGASVQIPVRFNPPGLGLQTGVLTLTSNADDNPTLTVTLAGTGTAPAGEPPHATVNPTSIARTLGVGRSTTVNLDISNTGGTDLNWQFTGVKQGLTFTAPYDATHFEPRIKGQADYRIGNPVLQAAGGPDTFGYQWADSDEPGGPVFQWTDIRTTGGTLLTQISSCDDCSQVQALSFPFPLYGNTFNSMNVATNGFINFGAPSEQVNNYPLPGTNMPVNLVAGFLDDLRTQFAGQIYFQDFGNRAIVQFQDVPRFLQDGVITFQMVLNANGSIYFYYLTATGNMRNGTTGIQNGTASTGLNVQYNTTYIKSGLAVRLSVVPDWLHSATLSGTVQPGTTQRVVTTLSAVGLEAGTYNQIMTLSHNNPAEASIQIPVALTVDASSGISRILRVGPSAAPMAVGSRFFMWNLSVGGEARGVAKGSRYTLYMK
jgi:bacillolysin